MGEGWGLAFLARQEHKRLLRVAGRRTTAILAGRVTSIVLQHLHNGDKAFTRQRLAEVALATLKGALMGAARTVAVVHGGVVVPVTASLSVVLFSHLLEDLVPGDKQQDDYAAGLIKFARDLVATAARIVPGTDTIVALASDHLTDISATCINAARGRMTAAEATASVGASASAIFLDLVFSTCIPAWLPAQGMSDTVRDCLIEVIQAVASSAAGFYARRSMRRLVHGLRAKIVSRGGAKDL